jgi:hypothetical protein
MFVRPDADHGQPSIMTDQDSTIVTIHIFHISIGEAQKRTILDALTPTG